MNGLSCTAEIGGAGCGIAVTVFAKLPGREADGAPPSDRLRLDTLCRIAPHAAKTFCDNSDRPRDLRPGLVRTGRRAVPRRDRPFPESAALPGVRLADCHRCRNACLGQSEP